MKTPFVGRVFIGRAAAANSSAVARSFYGALICGMLLSGAFRADADRISRGPVISPSVRQAHALKYYPPAGWIRHYLGDDRYKIGTTWRVVTTPNDLYYYPPFAREMLTAAPDQVIGFASAQDAQEAGYQPAPAYGSAFGLDIHQMAVEDARDNPEPASGGNSGSNVTTINRFKSPRGFDVSTSRRERRVLLKDGVSSVVVPAGWNVLTPQATSTWVANDPSAAMFLILASPNRKSIVWCASTSFSDVSVDMGNVVDARTVIEIIKKARSSALPGSPVARMVGRVISYNHSKLGSTKAWTVVTKTDTPFPNFSDISHLTVGGRGSKMYMVMQLGNITAADTHVILDSFRAR